MDPSTTAGKAYKFTTCMIIKMVGAGRWPICKVRSGQVRSRLRLESRKKMHVHTAETACLAEEAGLAERAARGDRVVAETGGLGERSLLGDRVRGFGC